MTINRLHEIEHLGQAIWLDDLSRQLIEDGRLQGLVDEDGLSGVTSNPTTFEKAIGHSDRYDGAFANALWHGQATAERSVHLDPDGAERHLELLREADVDVEDVVCHRLVEEGIGKRARAERGAGVAIRHARRVDLERQCARGPRAPAARSRSTSL